MTDLAALRAARFTAAELRDAAKVATEARAVIRMERGGTAVEVKPVDLAETEADRLDMMDLRRK